MSSTIMQMPISRLGFEDRDKFFCRLCRDDKEAKQVVSEQPAVVLTHLRDFHRMSNEDANRVLLRGITHIDMG